MPHTMKPVLTPAYGRDYAGLPHLLADLNDNRDFRANSPEGDGYINSAELQKRWPGATFEVRYSKGRKVAMIRWDDKHNSWKKA